MPSYAKLLPAHPGRDHSIATIASNSFESIQAKSIKSSTYSHLSDAELDLLAEGMQQRVQALRNRSRRRKTTLVMSREPEDESVHARNLQSKTLRHTERKPSEPIVEDEDAWDEELEQLRFDLRMTKMEGRQSELAISRKEKSTAQLSSLESEETLVDYAALDAEVLRNDEVDFLKDLLHTAKAVDHGSKTVDPCDKFLLEPSFVHHNDPVRTSTPLCSPSKRVRFNTMISYDPGDVPVTGDVL